MPETDAGPAPLRVLIVQDSAGAPPPDTALFASPAHVRRVGSLAEARAALASEQYDLVVLPASAEVLGAATDAAALSRQRARMEAIDAAGRELVALDADATAPLDLGDRLRLLEDKLIRYCRELLHFQHFAVRVRDPRTNRLETVLAGGFPEEAAALEIYALPEGNGLSGYVAATGQSVVCPDVSQEPRYLRGIDTARSTLTVPLRLVDRVVGVLNVESDQLNAFSDEDRQFAEILGRYIAVALHVLKLLAVERSETTGEVTADMQAELAEPLDAIVAAATRLLRDPGTADRAAVREVLQRVDQVKERLAAVGRTPTIRGLLPSKENRDTLLRGKRVLVADDEDIIRETIVDVLTKAGARPVMAHDGAEAIALLETQPFDLVLSDIKMPHKSGYEVFAAAKRVGPTCRVILMTGFGYDPEHNIVRAGREGLAGVLFKPFKMELLMETIHKALAPEPPPAA